MTAAVARFANAAAPWDLDRAAWDELAALLAELEDRLDAKEAAIRRLAPGGFADAGPLAPVVDLV